MFKIKLYWSLIYGLLQMSSLDLYTRWTEGRADLTVKSPFPPPAYCDTQHATDALQNEQWHKKTSEKKTHPHVKDNSNNGSTWEPENDRVDLSPKPKLALCQITKLKIIMKSGTRSLWMRMQLLLEKTCVMGRTFWKQLLEISFCFVLLWLKT